MTAGRGINVRATTTTGRKVTLYKISPFEHLEDGKPCVRSVTTDGASVRISAAEARRVRRTANQRDIT